MYSRSTSPSMIWPGRTDSAWLARARTFSDIVWPVIGIGGCTGAARPINMAMDGPKVLRDRRNARADGHEFHAQRGIRHALPHLGLDLARDPNRPPRRPAVPALIFPSQLGTAGLEQVFPMLPIVLGGTCAAFATVAVKRWGHDTEPISFNAASMAVGAAALAGVSLIAREPWAVPTWPQGLGAILYLAIAGSVVTFVAWQWLLKEMQATFLSCNALVIPIVAVLLGASLGNETFDVIDLAV